MKEKRKAKINFHKAGTGVGAKLTLPVPWLRKLEITQEEREVEIEVDDVTKEIKLKKRN